MVALELSYDDYIKLNGGNHCGICGRPPSARRKLDRDHDHKNGEPRGLLCSRCNRYLPTFMTIKWLENTIRYLQKYESN